MLAGVRAYMHVWQLPLFGLLVVGWLLGGGWILRRTLHQRERYRRITLGRCVLICFLGGVGGGLTGAVFFYLFDTIGGVIETDLKIVGGIVGAVLMGLIASLVIYAMLPISLGEAIRVGIRPVAMILVLLIIVGASAGVPAYFLRVAERQRNDCRFNLAVIAEALRDYRQRFGSPGTSLDALVEINVIPYGHLVCPATGEVVGGYVYRPGRIIDRNTATEQILVCDLRGNHRGGRNVLLANGQELWYSDDRFRLLLESEANKQFASDLQAVEDE